jgi:hypothetical protein
LIDPAGVDHRLKGHIKTHSLEKVRRIKATYCR